MKFQYPHVIENGNGERLTFKRLVKDDAGDWLEVASIVEHPKSGPPMHIHHLQDEHLAIVKGKMGVEVRGEAPKYYGVGEVSPFKLASRIASGTQVQNRYNVQAG